MTKGTSSKTAIDCFLWAREGQLSENRDCLIYYDQEGTQVQREIPQGAMDEALEIFKGKLKTVRRSSGGFGLVEPIQLVVCENPENRAEKPEIRIRVRFRDFRRNQHGVVCGAGYNLLSKTVLPQDLLPPFDLQYQTTQTFVMDFGHGIVPVHVFQHEIDTQDEGWVWFLEPFDLDRITRNPPGQPIEVQPFRASRDVLRFAIGAEYELAKLRYGELRRRYGRIVAEALRAGKRRAVPSGLAVSSTADYLRRLCCGNHSQDPRWEPASPQSEEQPEILTIVAVPSPG